MPSKQRIAVLRVLPRKTVQEAADAPKCQCHTFTVRKASAACPTYAKAS
jgi:hypothetical protein